MSEDQELHLRRQLEAARGDLHAAAAALRRTPGDPAHDAARHRLHDARLRLDELDGLLAGHRHRTRQVGGGAGELRMRVLPQVLSPGAGGEAPAGVRSPQAALEELLDRPRPLDDALVQALAEVTRALVGTYRGTAPGWMLGLLRAHVDRAASFLDLPARPALRARLGSVVGEAACLAGWVLHLAGRRGEAHAHFVLGRDVARDAGDGLVQGLATGAAASLFTTLTRGTAGGSRVAARLLQQAVALLPPATPPSARAWLHGRLAEELAALEDADGFRAALQQARRAFDDGRGPQDREGDRAGVLTGTGVLSFWRPAGPGPHLVEAFGYGLLGDRRGVDLLGPAVAQERRSGARATLLGDLATAHLRQGDLDQAAHTAAHMVDLAVQGRVLGRAERARGLRRQLPARLPAARELDDRLRDLGPPLDRQTA